MVAAAAAVASVISDCLRQLAQGAGRIVRSAQPNEADEGYTALVFVAELIPAQAAPLFAPIQLAAAQLLQALWSEARRVAQWRPSSDIVKSLVQSLCHVLAQSPCKDVALAIAR